MIAIRAHYDGKYVVPDEPVQLPKNRPLNVQIDVVDDAGAPGDGRQVSEFLRELAELGERLPADAELPVDGAAQHDHYLYGTPKR
ncbi:MAG: hypothetical protein NTW87_25610 [Planctomycetota bacterium]|nr:hypothetical protein [Planctomycetota bacterium]